MTEPLRTPETAREIVMPVVDRLKEFDPQMIKDALDKVHSPDQKAGIIIAHLDDISPIETPDGSYKFHAARVLTEGSPEAPNYVNPHLHEEGEEPYLIIAGSDMEINLGRVVNDNEGNRSVAWDEPKLIKAGDVIIVEEGQVHSLRNTGKEPVDFIFACPQSHLTDKTEENPQGDRQFTKNLPNGIPSHYPKQS